MEQVHVRRMHTLKRTQMGSVIFKHPAEARIRHSGLSPLRMVVSARWILLRCLERAAATSESLEKLFAGQMPLICLH
jgi:hypothetical protein